MEPPESVRCDARPEDSHDRDHRLPRRRQDQPHPPCAERSERAAHRAHHQRVRRPRHRPGRAAGMRRYGLRRNRYRRARQRLHLLHRRRRLRAGDRGVARPRPRARAHPDRDLGPCAPQTPGRRLQLARDPHPAHRRRRGRGGGRPGAGGRPLRRRRRRAPGPARGGRRRSITSRRWPRCSRTRSAAPTW